MVRMAQPMAPRFLPAMAVATYEPTPGRVMFWLPTVIASEATTKNQAPDIDIIMFQIRPGMANGSSSRRKRISGLKRRLLLASTRSGGKVRSDWYTENAMFQAWAVKMANTEASSAPSTLPGNRPRKNGHREGKKP